MPDTLESLRATLRTLEESAGSGDYSAHLAALKSFLLNRIAELEIAADLESSDAKTASADSSEGSRPSQRITDGVRDEEVVVHRRGNKAD